MKGFHMNPCRVLKQVLFVVAVTPAAFNLMPLAIADDTPGPVGKAEITVGVDEGDIRGSDQRALQMAVDYVASMGGGTVHIGPGRYQMRNALALRDHVHVQGTPGQTVLAAEPGRATALALDGDCNERQVTLAEPEGFQVGDGIVVADERNGSGFTVTAATLTEQLDDHSFRISAPLYLDYMVADGATARQAFPIVAGTRVTSAVVEGLSIEGHPDSQPLDGCRGAGMYLFECEDVTIRNCVVRHYPGDGISFQVSQRVTVEGCTCEKNAGLGLHPGSGSQHPVVRKNVARNNGGDGLFVCWRVKHGRFEDNELVGNLGHGISIGHKDTDNLFRGNRVIANGRYGVLFRGESEAMGAHRNVFEANVILDNGHALADDEAAAIVIQGVHHDVVFRGNTIGRSGDNAPSVAGIRAGRGAVGLDAADNEFQGVGSAQLNLED